MLVCMRGEVAAHLNAAAARGMLCPPGQLAWQFVGSLLTLPPSVMILQSFSG